jgi:hypothetical protein
MNRFSALIIGLSILAVGCGDSDPTAPTQGTTTTSTFTVPLSPSKEVPAITNADASGSGSVVIALTVTKDNGGNIMSATANFQISVSGFPAGTRVTDAHIHNAPAGSNGGIQVSVGLASGSWRSPTAAARLRRTASMCRQDRAAAILGNRAAFYFNVHTALNPDGAIRGQLSEGPFDPGTAVPY